VNQIEQTIAQVKAAYGSYQGVDSLAAGAYRVRFAYGSATVRVHLDAAHRIDGLVFASLQFSSLSRAAAADAIQRLPGGISLLVLENSNVLQDLDGDLPLAVGSAFKLAVLAALQRQIAAHRLAWSQEVTLLAHDKSLPSGILQTHATGTPYTISDVARYMISISDNTAANMLIRVVGRAAIDPLIPASDQPIVTTREFFILKDPANSALRERYLAAKTPVARTKVLPDVDKLPLPPVTVFIGSKPVSPEIEWFFSTSQLCALIGKVAALPQMSVNPGVASPLDWKHVAFKGGSEVGTINLTTEVTSKSGATYCVSATWNNIASLDEPRFNMLYAGILSSYR
jgi:beta-lactamase class A